MRCARLKIGFGALIDDARDDVIHAGEIRIVDAGGHAGNEVFLAVGEVDGGVHLGNDFFFGPFWLIDDGVFDAAHEADFSAPVFDQLRQVVGGAQAALPNIDSHFLHHGQQCLTERIGVVDDSFGIKESI